jgi:hypothetical protein
VSTSRFMCAAYELKRRRRTSAWSWAARGEPAEGRKVMPNQLVITVVICQCGLAPQSSSVKAEVEKELAKENSLFDEILKCKTACLLHN